MELVDDRASLPTRRKKKKTPRSDDLYSLKYVLCACFVNLCVFLCLLVLVLFSVELICFVSFFYCFLAVLSINHSIYNLYYI